MIKLLHLGSDTLCALYLSDCGTGKVVGKVEGYAYQILRML